MFRRFDSFPSPPLSLSVSCLLSPSLLSPTPDRRPCQAEEAAKQKEQEKILNRPKKLSMSLKKGGLF